MGEYKRDERIDVMRSVLSLLASPNYAEIRDSFKFAESRTSVIIALPDDSVGYLREQVKNAAGGACVAIKQDDGDVVLSRWTRTVEDGFLGAGEEDRVGDILKSIFPHLAPVLPTPEGEGRVLAMGYMPA